MTELLFCNPPDCVLTGHPAVGSVYLQVDEAWIRAEQRLLRETGRLPEWLEATAHEKWREVAMDQRRERLCPQLGHEHVDKHRGWRIEHFSWPSSL